MCKDNEIFKNQPAILACEVRLAKGVFCLSVVKTGYKPASESSQTAPMNLKPAGFKYNFLHTCNR